MKILLFVLFIMINFLPREFTYVKLCLLSAFMIFWMAYVLILIWHFQKNKALKNPREENLYIKDIPKQRTVNELSYLLNKKIEAPVLGISLMELVRKKALLLRYNPKNNDYIFLYNDEQLEKSTYSEKFLSDWLLTKIGNGEKVSLSLIRKDAYMNSAFFLSCYDDWKTLASIEGTKPTFFETTNYVIDGNIGYIVLSIVLALIGLYNQAPPLFPIFSLLCTLVVIFYLDSFYLRTKEGNSEYLKWRSFALSIKKGDACNNVSSLATLEKLVIYAKILRVNTSKMWATITAKNLCNVDKSDFIKYSMVGIADEIVFKMEKYVNTAMAISFVFSRNRGSKANIKYKRKERV